VTIGSQKKRRERRWVSTDLERGGEPRDQVRRYAGGGWKVEADGDTYRDDRKGIIGTTVAAREKDKPVVGSSTEIANTSEDDARTEGWSGFTQISRVAGEPAVGKSEEGGSDLDGNRRWVGCGV